MSHNARTERVGDLIREELSAVLTRDVRDPGVRHVTVTRVRMTKDLEHARVYYTVLADARGARDAARALRRARRFLKRQLGRLGLRRVPELTFFYDDSVAQQDRVVRLFDEISAANPEDVHTDEPDAT